MTRLAMIALAGALLAASGCGGDGEQDQDEVSCADEQHADTYAGNLARVGREGNLTVVLVSSDPAPPSIGDNAWTVQLNDPANRPVDGASLTITPFMPEHGHGTPVDVEVTEADGGLYGANPVNLWMPGVWEITIDAATAAGDDSVMFAFCIDG